MKTVYRGGWITTEVTSLTTPPSSEILAYPRTGKIPKFSPSKKATWKSWESRRIIGPKKKETVLLYVDETPMQGFLVVWKPSYIELYRRLPGKRTLMWSAQCIPSLDPYWRRASGQDLGVAACNVGILPGFIRTNATMTPKKEYCVLPWNEILKDHDGETRTIKNNGTFFFWYVK